MSKNVNMNKVNLFGLILVILSLFILGGMIYCINKQPEQVIKRDTVQVVDFKWKTDTFEVEKLVPKFIEKLKVDTFYTKEGNDTILTTEIKQYKDTLCQDKDTLVLTSYIKGVNPSLDSISAIWKKQEKIITNTITIEKYIEKKKRLYISPQLGVGYGLTNKKVDIFLGVGVGLNL